MPASVSSTSNRMRAFPALVILTLSLVALTGVRDEQAVADPLQERLGQTRERLRAADQRAGVLTSTIERYRERGTELRTKVARLRERSAVLAADLAEIEQRLEAARARRRDAEDELRQVRERLVRASGELKRLLVSLYRSGEPGVITVLLESDGFEELLSRSEYADRLADYRSSVIERVRVLRARAADAVRSRRQAEAEIEGARAAIVDWRARLDTLRGSLEARRSSLRTVLGRERRALAAVNGRQARLEEVESRLQVRIQAQLEASATAAAPAGPASPEAGTGSVSGAALIWPVQGPITSPFGPRWGRLHAGIDISAAGGTPIRAAASGTVEIASPNGGYGNYTCLNHAGGLSTCYAHQSGFATSAGATVKQGEVIGYVGNTGNSFGDHLHFEVRTNGAPQDPLGYL